MRLPRPDHCPPPGQRCWRVGQGNHPAPLPTGAAARALESYLAAGAAPLPPRRGSGLAMAARPGLGGRVINSRHRRPAPAAPPAAADTGSRPARAGGRAHLARLRPAGGGSGRAARGRGEAAAPRPAGVGAGWGGGGGDGGWSSASLNPASPEIVPNLLPLHPAPTRTQFRGAGEERVSLQPQGSTFPTRPAGERGQSWRGWGGEPGGTQRPCPFGNVAADGNLAAPQLL